MIRRLKIEQLNLYANILVSLVFILVCVPAFPAKGSARSTYVYPLVAPKLSSKYGVRIHPIRKFSKKHNGIDLAVPEGATIRAISSGVVVFADKYKGYGNLIVIKHSNGFTSHYGHCSKIRVRTGQRVNIGEVIGAVGSTGLSTAPHLHFEIRINGVPQDPERFITGISARAEG